ncbi:MAG TPA: hypothetical protein VJS14_02630 [Enterobacteriaceae bacterium]|nr:hypothetical protein [Enterobacteriaceae bacterium]
MTKTSLLIVLLLNLGIVLTAVFWHQQQEQLSLNCHGYLSFNDSNQHSQFRFEGLVVIQFSPDGSGSVNLNGNIAAAGEVWPVSRQESFSWRHTQERFYDISIVSIERFGHDKVPDGVLEKYVAGLMPGQKRQLKIEKTADNALILSNFYSPLLVCAI